MMIEINTNIEQKLLQEKVFMEKEGMEVQAK
jgi:hypothetical protein